MNDLGSILARECIIPVVVIATFLQANQQDVKKALKIMNENLDRKED